MTIWPESTAGARLARRLWASNEDDPEFGPVLAEVCTEVEADREELKAVMDRLGVEQEQSQTGRRHPR